jgi:hypothetical protein
MMIHMNHRSRNLVFGLCLIWLTATLLFGYARSVQAAQQERSAAAQQDRPAAARQERPPAARAERPTTQQREFRDERYNLNRAYPVRGQVVPALPRDHRVVTHGGVRYYFHGGVWYRPQGPRFAIIAPPIGLFVPFLPPFYATVWFGGRPYYYANEVYYTHRGDGYVIVEPPQGDISQAPPPIDQLFIYPRHNQSDQQQATDRYECHRWAVSQTGFDPTLLHVPEDPKGQKRADYQRAMSACLEGRGYTVK